MSRFQGRACQVRSSQVYHAQKRIEKRIARAGTLPKIMPVSLETLDVSGGYDHHHKFTGGIPAEWSSMTNLKELRMAHCRLNGGSWSLQLYPAEAN